MQIEDTAILSYIGQIVVINLQRGNAAAVLRAMGRRLDGWE